MIMGVHHPYPLDLCAYDEDPSQLIIRPGWEAPHVRCSPRTFCAWPCLLRQVGTVLGSPYDCVVARLAYTNPGSRQTWLVLFLHCQEIVFLQLQPLCCLCHSRLSHNLMHLQNPSFYFGSLSEDFLGAIPDSSSGFVVGFLLETYSDSFAASHFRCLLARRTTLTIVLGYFATLTYLL